MLTLIDRVVGSSTGFYSLIASSYVLDALLLVPKGVIIHLGFEGFVAVGALWCHLIAAVLIWHPRRWIWLMPNALVAFGLYEFFDEQSRCPPQFIFCQF